MTCSVSGNTTVGLFSSLLFFPGLPSPRFLPVDLLSSLFESPDARARAHERKSNEQTAAEGQTNGLSLARSLGISDERSSAAHRDLLRMYYAPLLKTHM